MEGQSHECVPRAPAGADWKEMPGNRGDDTDPLSSHARQDVVFITESVMLCDIL